MYLLIDLEKVPPPFPGPFKCGRTNVAQSRVVNGFDAKEGAWPWLGSLQNKGSHWCGSTLIAPNWVCDILHQHNVSF